MVGFLFCKGNLMRPSAIKRAIERAFAAGLVPFIKGSPGIGKSAIIRQIAKEAKLLVIDLRLGQCDPTDLLGFPNIENGRSVYHPPKDIPIVGDKVPEGYNGWLLFLDEMNTAPKAVQAAAYKLLDRMVGQTKLHPQVYIAAAGNKDTDGAITATMSSATLSRIVNLELDVNYNDWEIWALANNIDHRIIGFLHFKKEAFHKFDPKNLREPFPCPRTWDFTNRAINGLEVDIKSDLGLLSGIIGKGTAREFIEYCAVYGEIATLAEILANPEGVTIKDQPDIKYAYAGFAASSITVDNATQMMKFINRLPVEFQIVALSNAFKAKPMISAVPEVMDWVTRYANDSGEGML